MKNKKKNLNIKGLFLVLNIFVLGTLIFFLSNKNQNLNKAKDTTATQTTIPANIYFSPASTTLPPDGAIKMMVASGSEPVAFIHAEIVFDKTKARLTQEVSVEGSPLSRVVEKTTMTEANSLGKVTLALALDPSKISSPPSQTFSIASLTLAPNTTTNDITDTVKFTNVVIVNTKADLLAPTTTALSLKLNPSPVTEPQPETLAPACTTGSELLSNNNFSSSSEGWSYWTKSGSAGTWTTGKLQIKSGVGCFSKLMGYGLAGKKVNLSGLLSRDSTSAYPYVSLSVYNAGKWTDDIVKAPYTGVANIDTYGKVQTSYTVPATATNLRVLYCADATSGTTRAEWLSLCQEEVTVVTPPPPPEPPAAASKITVYAAGSASDGIYPTMQLLINDSVVKQWTGIKGNYSNRYFLAYSYDYALDVKANQIKVKFVNDAKSQTGDRNLYVDKMVLNGVTYQSESDSSYSLGTWLSADGCGTGYRKSEVLACNGYIQYDKLQASTISIYAAGSAVSGIYPTMRLTIDGKVVKEWQNVKGSYKDRSFIRYTYTATRKVNANQIKVYFTNDGKSSTEDRNLYVDKIIVDSVTYESEAPATYSVGTWKSYDGCNSGYRGTEVLACNGYFGYDSK